MRLVLWNKRSVWATVCGFQSCKLPNAFKNDINKASARLRGSFREEFKTTYTKMCSVTNEAEYNKQKCLDEMVNLLPDIAKRHA